ncbi:hypothetical protein ARMSODRAFT_292271 [Armillaria solidipes]|uniref:Uncharacterized protein n=1 Tax=Armillaria solidipes TaxID=1076256 RepID=A0A2H3BAX5_9AGAR|nr:hypothetical protein ARMSODRAFT_292271 [Armillaria solidipes]
MRYSSRIFARFPQYVARHLTITPISLHRIGLWCGVIMPKETLVKGTHSIILDTSSSLKSFAG